MRGMLRCLRRGRVTFQMVIPTITDLVGRQFPLRLHRSKPYLEDSCRDETAKVTRNRVHEATK